MVVRARPPRRLALGLPASVLVACTLNAGCGPRLPGTVLGTYQVNAALQTDACGLGAPAQYQFDVELSEETTASGQTLHWSWLTNTPIASGALAPVSAGDPTLRATLTASQTGNVDGTAASPGPCTMARDDTLVVDLGAGTPPGTFSGTMRYAFSAVAGADCGDQLRVAGGMYAALPCAVSYTIAGKWH